jgi:hypothetical protein
MKEYGAFMESYWRQKLELLDKSLSPCHSLHHQCDTDGSGIESGGRSDNRANNRLSNCPASTPWRDVIPTRK